MKKITVIALMVGSVCQFAQAQSLEQAVAQTLTTNPKIKEAYSLYLARQYNVDEAQAGLFAKTGCDCRCWARTHQECQ